MHINLKLCISARNYLPDLFTQQVTKGASGEFGQQLGREGLSPLPLAPRPSWWLVWLCDHICSQWSGPNSTNKAWHEDEGILQKKDFGWESGR